MICQSFFRKAKRMIGRSSFCCILLAEVCHVGIGQEVMILVYHEQYVDTVLLHVMLEEGKENTVTIELFQKNDLPNQQVSFRLSKKLFYRKRKSKRNGNSEKYDHFCEKG